MQGRARLKRDLPQLGRIGLDYVSATFPEPPMLIPSPLITRSSDRLSGAAVFAGTRVLVQTMIDSLDAGDSLDRFLDDFPSVSPEHAVAVRELAREALDAQASAA
ncbi:MAG TPA: DUF433 domain-containing protein [Longimicrobium sp.]|nr:DUF433 domain-containing protein [Longimicrobium sp.]